MTDDTPDPTAPDAAPTADPGPSLPPGPRRPPSSADVRAHRPEYKGAELDPERGPGLGCFWFQVAVLGFFIVLIPVGLNLGWPFELLAILLFIVIGLLLLTGQTVIFLLRLVAADRRAQGRRRPLASPTKTVGELEDDHRIAHAVGPTPRQPDAAPTPATAPEPAEDEAVAPATAPVPAEDEAVAPAADAEPTADVEPATPAANAEPTADVEPATRAADAAPASPAASTEPEPGEPPAAPAEPAVDGGAAPEEPGPGVRQ